MPNHNTQETPGSTIKVWVVEESNTTPDDGDYATEIIAVHATEAGAKSNLTPDYETSGYMQGTRYRVCYEIDLLP